MSPSPLNVVCLGKSTWSSGSTAMLQLLTRLARGGHRVLYIDPGVEQRPLRGRRRLAAIATIHDDRRIRQLEPNLYIFTFRAYASTARVNRWRRSRAIREAVREFGFAGGIALILHPDAADEADLVDPRGIVYCAGIDTAGSREMSRHVRDGKALAEERVLRRADVALGASTRMVERFAERNPSTALLTSGADTARFSPDALAAAISDPVLAALPRPRLGVIGRVDARVDQQLLESLARARPDMQIALVGRIDDAVEIARLQLLPNVHLLGHREHAALPGVLRELDVCLLPHTAPGQTEDGSPHVVFDCLATGLPVVATDVEELGPCRNVISIAANEADFIALVEEAVARPHDGMARRLAFARANDWEARTAELVEHLRVAVRPRPTLVPPSALVDQDPLAPAPFQGSTAHRVLRHVTRSTGRLYHAGRMLARAVTGSTSRDPRRILVVRRGRLGDFLLFEPTLRALRATFPDARIVLGVHAGAPAAPLFADSGLIDDIRTIDHLATRNLRRKLRGVISLWAEGFDLVISGARHFAMREALLSGAPRMVGLYDDDPLQLLNDELLSLDPGRHEAENNLVLAEALGARVTEEERRPRLGMRISDVERAFASERSEIGLAADAAYAVLHPGAQKPSRRWPIERFAELGSRLLAERPELQLVVTGAGEERELGGALLAQLADLGTDRLHDAVGRTSLHGLTGLLAGSSLTVCNDTGVMHLARTAGAPLLALLGPENDTRWGPHPAGIAPAIALRHVVPCAPCQLWECAPLYCLRTLSVDEALIAARDLLDGRASTRLDRRASTWEWGELEAADQVGEDTLAYLRIPRRPLELPVHAAGR